MHISWAIDWIAFNAVGTYDLNHQSMAHASELWKWVECKGKHGYDRATENSDGARIMWSSTRQDMGTFTSYPGRAISAYRDREISAVQIITKHLENGDICRRLDLAIDAIDSSINIEAMYRQFQNGAVNTTAKKYKLLTGSDGDTLYIGSRESEQFIRIYDKAKEMGDFTTDRIRIELELKGSRAEKLAKLIATDTEDQAIKRTQGLINSVVEFKSKVWREIMGSEVVAIAKSKDDQADTEKWLLQSVAPAMAKYIKKSGNAALLVRFIRIVTALSADENIDDNQ